MNHKRKTTYLLVALLLYFAISQPSTTVNAVVLMSENESLFNLHNQTKPLFHPHLLKVKNHKSNDKGGLT